MSIAMNEAAKLGITKQKLNWAEINAHEGTHENVHGSSVFFWDMEGQLVYFDQILYYGVRTN